MKLSILIPVYAFLFIAARVAVSGDFEHFIERVNAKLGTKIRGVDNKARKILLDYPWPGNVRELENLVERAVVLGGSGELDRADFAFLSSHPRSVSDTPSNGYAFSGLSLGELEQLHIRHVVEACEGNRSAAARILGIDRSTLWKKLKEMG